MARKEARLHLQNSPLIMVLAQVRFSPVLKMAEFVPQLQEQLRHQGYPRFRAAQVNELELGAQPRVTQQDRWFFADKDNHEAVVLASDFIVLETSKYDCFEEFSARLKSLLEILGNGVEVGLSERLGLRYVDLILPSLGETLDQYLQPGLRGLRASDLETKNVLNRFEARGQTNLGQLVLKLHQNDTGSFLPPDLLLAELTYDRTVEQGTVVTLLDIDHFSEQSRDYDPEALLKTMWELHEYTEKAFRSSITPLALERWGQK
jgi:uncharacterized protein (TIGR04255 family)